MRLFDIFKKPLIIDDDFFGKLRFMKMKTDGKSYFEGKGMFKPTGKEIEYFITANEEGPDQRQKEFYNWIEENYSTLVLKLKPLIEDEFGNSRDGFKIKDFDIEFQLVALSIPNQENEPLEWSMSFDTVHDENHQVTVEFSGHEPQAILIDG
ncbi:hypothetical protein ACMA1I_14880 [Pontibacter sp. 13R65]|uniref:hypothetical protein n=1 Tax=Pontibacter sp. 13R65 TaxID=3127458 RepID=UPI00301B6F8A